MIALAARRGERFFALTVGTMPASAIGNYMDGPF
jgi:hypothetical protein